MMTPTVTEIREALATAIAAGGVRASAYFPEGVNAPVAIVEGPEADFNEDTMSDNYTFPIRILVGDATQRSASLTLDAMLSSTGDTSVRRIIEAEDTLGGVVQYATVVGIRDYGTHVVQNVEYLGANLLVTVVAYKAMS